MRVSSRAPSRAPITPQAIPYLALFKHENGPLAQITPTIKSYTLSPSTPGRMFSLGIWTSSMRIIPVVLARSDNLPLIGGQSSPFIP